MLRFRTLPAAPLILMLILCSGPCGLADASPLSGSSPKPWDSISLGCSFSVGYFQPETPDLGMDLAGPSLGFTLTFMPIVLQTPLLQIGARFDIDLAAVILFDGGREGQAECSANAIATFGPWAGFAPFVAGGVTLVQYAVYTPDDVSASELGRGYRIACGALIGQKTGVRYRTFVVPEVVYSAASLETIEYSYLHFRLSWTALMTP
jgi:hypothetical protein